MRNALLLCLAAGSLLVPAMARADDPHDPAMRSAAARARDHETIRQLNLQELAKVRRRDARYAEGWRAWRANGGSPDASADDQARSRDHDHARADYARRRAQYARDLAEWRRAVARCRQGDYAACDSDR